MTKETPGSATYAVVYEGSPIPLPAPVYWPYGLAAVVLVGGVISGILLWKNRRNAKIYALIDGEYRVVQKIRISYIDPIIDLPPPAWGLPAGNTLSSSTARRPSTSTTNFSGSSAPTAR